MFCCIVKDNGLQDEHSASICSIIQVCSDVTINLTHISSSTYHNVTSFLYFKFFKTFFNKHFQKNLLKDMR